MCKSERTPHAILGSLLIFALLATPGGAFAKGDMIADGDYAGGMQPGDPEGGDRIFDDTPFDNPSGTTRHIQNDPEQDGRTISDLQILVVPIRVDYLVIIQIPYGSELYPILRSR